MNGSIWVGQLELEGGPSVTGMNSTEPAEHDIARVLVRLHGAPLGFVSVATRPAQALATRARAAAETMLAGALRRHIDADRCDDEPTCPARWEHLVTCPRRFSAHGRPGVSIAVCTRNRTPQLWQSLRALRQVSYEPVEILVVDNAPSTDSTRQLVTELTGADPRIRYVRESRPGLSRARNRALAEARYGIVAFTDDDTLADPGWPTAIVAGFAADPEALCVTGPVFARALGTASQRYFEAYMPWDEAIYPRRYDLAESRHPSPLYPFTPGIFGFGANFAVRADPAIAIGGFDAALGAGGPCRGGEDLDILLRLVLAGGRICYLPSVLVWHFHRASADELADQMYSYGHGLGAYVAKHLREKELRSMLLKNSVRGIVAVRERRQRASETSHIGRGGKRLAINESLGFIVGAARYWPARGQLARSARSSC